MTIDNYTKALTINHWHTLSQQFLLDKPINKDVLKIHIDGIYEDLSLTPPNIKYVSNPKQAVKYAELNRLKSTKVQNIFYRFADRYSHINNHNIHISPFNKYFNFYLTLDRNLNNNYLDTKQSHISYNAMLHTYENYMLNTILLHEDWTIYTKIISHLYYLYKHVSFSLFYDDTVVIAENPEIILFNDNQQIHSIKDGAIIYDSTYKVYAYKGNLLDGIIFPIIKPHLITKDYFHRISDARVLDLCIDIKGREWLFSQFTPSKKHSHKNYGILWKIQLKHFAIQYLEVVNGSPEPDGTYKTYWLRVPGNNISTSLEAVAWTYGMTAIDYLRLVQRT